MTRAALANKGFDVTCVAAHPALGGEACAVRRPARSARPPARSDDFARRLPRAAALGDRGDSARRQLPHVSACQLPHVGHLEQRRRRTEAHAGIIARATSLGNTPGKNRGSAPHHLALLAGGPRARPPRARTSSSDGVTLRRLDARRPRRCDAPDAPTPPTLQTPRRCQASKPRRPPTIATTPPPPAIQPLHDPGANRLEPRIPRAIRREVC